MGIAGHAQCGADARLIATTQELLRHREIEGRGLSQGLLERIQPERRNRNGRPQTRLRRSLKTTNSY
ncbi:hypothetical protein [Mesorhizobium australicum]|uniref:hypothetical protein n=1 Tax=Mesorhizobium australicum TaxID=536018 RepID=UPI000A1CAAE1|nr:hypothetical protein [Mesorhizobium australicum]